MERKTPDDNSSPSPVNRRVVNAPRKRESDLWNVASFKSVTGIEITGEQTSSYITAGPFISAIYINWWRFATRRILIKTMMPLNFARAKCISTARWSGTRFHNFPCFVTPTLNGGKINNYRWQNRPGSCIIEAWVGNVIITRMMEHRAGGKWRNFVKLMFFKL